MTTRLVTQEVTKSPTRLAAGLPIPLLLMPLQTDLRLLRGVGTATFTRSTIGTFVDKDTGLVKTAAIDVAAFEQNGILIEGASDNLLLRSEEFDNAVHVKVRTTISTNTATAPDGAITADTLIEDSTVSSTHYVSQDVTIPDNTDHTISYFVKAKERTKFQIQGIAKTGGTRTGKFDLSLGTIISESEADAARIQALGNGYFRCSYKFNSSLGGVTPSARAMLLDAAGNATYNGDGASGIFIWGAQLEELPFASSYIKTVASTVTKTDEDTDVDAANIPAPTADYTISMEVDAIGFDSGLSQVLFNVAGETSRRIAWNTTTGAIEATHGAVTSVSTSTFSAGDRVKISFAVDATNQTLYINGIQEDQDAKGSVTGTATAINIGHQAGVNQAFSHIKPLRIDKIPLTAAQVGAL